MWLGVICLAWQQQSNIRFSCLLRVHAQAFIASQQDHNGKLHILGPSHTAQTLITGWQRGSKVELRLERPLLDQAMPTSDSLTRI